MHALIDCRMAQWSGIGRYTRGLVRGLDATGDVELTLLTARDDDPLLPESGDRVTVVRASASPLSFAGMREFSSAIRAARPDVAHCPHIPTPLSSDVPLVVTVHDLIPLLVRGVMPSPVRRRVFRFLVGRAVRRARCVIVPSHSTARDLERMFPDGADRIAVIPEAADELLAVSPEPVAPEVIEPGTPYLFSMGNTRPHKDLPTLLAAFHLLAPAHPELRLLLAGEGPAGYLDAWLSGEARSRVRFTGPVTDGQLRTLYEHAAVFAFPSRYEGFGLPPLEAMALGTPVVIADAASLPEVTGDAALTFEPGEPGRLAECIARVLDDPAERERLVAAGRERAAGFTWESTAKQTLEAYRKAVRR